MFIIKFMLKALDGRILVRRNTIPHCRTEQGKNSTNEGKVNGSYEERDNTLN